MILYRISNCNYINDLSGTGTRLYGGRWNSKGKPGLYLASSRALAVLEVLVHLQPLLIPDNFCLAEIEVPDDSIEQVAVNHLPSNWKDISPPGDLKKIGDNFLLGKKHLTLKIPSAVVEAEFNFLVNPLHPDMQKVKILNQEPFSFDERLIS
jgi:RES domain-containing protein